MEKAHRHLRALRCIGIWGQSAVSSPNHGSNLFPPHPVAQALTGMPHASGVTDKVGDLAVEIADLKNRIQALEAELAREETRLASHDGRPPGLFRILQV